MLNKILSRNSIEVLEARIAPAALLPSTDDKYVPASFNGAVEVFEGQVLNTTGNANSGTYFLYMEKGNALVYFTDFNNNRQVDFNELTGIAAGDGTRMVIFSDVHGDIVTNLKETVTTVVGANGQLEQKTKLTLSDSDNNAANDTGTPGDGRVLLNNTIEKIEMRSLRLTDIENQDDTPGVDDRDIAKRKVPSTYSIFGNIYAGKGFGAEDGGLIIDVSGGSNFGFELIPTIGSIKTGTAASGEYFSFGVSRGDDKSGTLTQFIPPRGQVGGDIIGVRPADNATKYNLNTLHAGDGGLGARGGNIMNVLIPGDDSGGYEVIAGNGGDGVNGGQGGSIINFTDLGSQTGRVVIRSGDGGIGTGGAGGNGGDFSFQTFNIRGDVSLKLGDGGDGFVRGGNGASLAKGDFSQPDFSTFTPANGTGVTHLGSTANWQQGSASYQAMIGSTQAVDFDRDGNGDFVFTTRGTSQVVVMFGDGSGGFRTRIGTDGVIEPDRYVLSGVRNPEALTVADLNGDGVMDIAVGSADAGSHIGIAVFLGKFETKNNVSSFVGFTDARYSALPTLEAVPIAPGVISNGAGWQSPHQVTSLVAGDFDGNGLPELALVLTQYADKVTDSNGVTLALENPSQFLLYLKPDVEMDLLTNTPRLTGQFYADFGTKGPNGEPVTVQRPFQAITLGEPESSFSVPRVIIEASARSSTSTKDAVFVGVVGSRVVETVEIGDLTGNPSVTFSYSLGWVDTDRELQDQNNPHRSPERVTLLDFAVFDYGGTGGSAGTSDGIADIIALTESPDLFMVGVSGETGLQTSGGGVSSPEDVEQNAGNYFGSLGYSATEGSSLLNIRAADIDGDGSFDDAVVHYVGKRGDDWLAGLVYQTGPLRPEAGLSATITPAPAQTEGAMLKFDLPAEPGDDRPDNYGGPSVFGMFYADANDLTKPSFGVADSNGFNDFYFSQIDQVLNVGDPQDPADDVLSIQQSLFIFFEPFVSTGLQVQAGNGGNATVGNGGKGGSLGGGSSVQSFTIIDTDLNGQPIAVVVTDLVGSLNMRISGLLRLEAGSGGDGFNKGGDGGDITGVTLRQRANDDVFLNSNLVTGSGGRGVAGSGGNGGDILGSSIDGFFVNLVTGNGGQGNTGGDGGSVRGNGTRIYDAFTAHLSIQTGDGGAGASKGGSGGSISAFSPILSELDESQPLRPEGSIVYIAGDGGSSVSGRGGDGGSITNSAPRKNAFFDSLVSLEAGNGGSGTKGGNGGSITQFRTTISGDADGTSSFKAIAGHGGAGTSGKGGAGGDITNVHMPSRGIDSFNRIMAGNGGSSAAAAGGNGGNVKSASTGSVDGSAVVVGGAGGHGLTAGGKGGSVSNVTLDIGGASIFSKGLVIAGAGGDASAFIPNPNDPSKDQDLKAYGGKVGRGGLGGSIVGFTQIGNQEAHVDLIAGNGGSTLNYGTIDDKKIYVGAGGSIRKVTMAGNVGNLTADKEGTIGLDENVPIKSYNKILLGETIAGYVEQNLRYSTGILSDLDGNVGAVVGVSGKTKAVQIDPVNEPGVYTRLPATGAQNGSIVGMTVSNIMSAVAGSVDRIAAIQVVKGLVVINGVIGADKGSFETPGIDPAPPNEGSGDLNKGFGTIGSNTRDYLQTDLDSLTTTGGPVRDGALIDGAIFAQKTLDGRGNPVKLDGRVFTIR